MKLELFLINVKEADTSFKLAAQNLLLCSYHIVKVDIKDCCHTQQNVKYYTKIYSPLSWRTVTSQLLKHIDVRPVMTFDLLYKTSSIRQSI